MTSYEIKGRSGLALIPKYLNDANEAILSCLLYTGEAPGLRQAQTRDVLAALHNAREIAIRMLVYFELAAEANRERVASERSDD